MAVPREVVFELSPRSGTGGCDTAAAALRDLPGVREAHVDGHGTWALVSFDPTVVTVATLTGCLGAHGLDASRMRNLAGGPDAGGPT